MRRLPRCVRWWAALWILTGAPAVAAQSANEALDSLSERYFEDLLPLDPLRATSIGDARYNDRFTPSFLPEIESRTDELDRSYRRSLEAIDRAGLDEAHRLTYDVLTELLGNAIAVRTFPGELLPLDPLNSFTSTFVSLGSGDGLHPFHTVADYEAFLARARGFEAAVNGAIANLRHGAETGVVLPRVLVERLIPQLSAQVVPDYRTSAFHRPVEHMPASFSADERALLSGAYAGAIRDGIVPAYRKLRDFLQNEYLPRARETVGWSTLPNGRDWYAALVRQQTTTDLTPERIHDLGLSEVERLHGEMRKIQAEVGFAGSLQDFFVHLREPRFQFESREQMLEAYRGAKARIDASTDKLFDVKPKADYEIRPVEEFREQSAAPGSYRSASPDGARPGIFYVNTYEPRTRARSDMVDILLHEGSPGHHFQISVARERSDLVRIRRFGSFTAYVEGWGLYAETLGAELGVFADPYERYGSLNWELWRAIRLVLDTGIHAKGWTREQAIEYARANSSQGEPTIVQEVERFIANPGQALTYKIGQLEFTELRRRAEAALGADFDPKAFHRALLEDGPLPLAVLDAKMDRWIAARRRTLD